MSTSPQRPWCLGNGVAFGAGLGLMAAILWSPYYYPEFMAGGAAVGLIVGIVLDARIP